jgi:hypothetical protein
VRALAIGDQVKLTGQFLKTTGQKRGGEGGKKWTVVACDCGLCASRDYIAVDEKSSFAMPDEPQQRHLNAGNVYRVGTLDSRNA